MLKGCLLAKMEDGKPRTEANDLWRKRLRNLEEQSDDAGSDFLKTWLRSQYSTKIRERKRGPVPKTGTASAPGFTAGSARTLSASG
jgi:hypothetical protein